MVVLATVIIPVFNAEKFIYKCLDSVIKQTYSNIEIIVVDDGSTDNSAEIIRKIGDRRVNLLNKKNKGVSNARNEGLKHVKGEVVVFVDADDYLEPQYIETMVKAMEISNSDIAICGYNTVNEEGKVIDTFPLNDKRIAPIREGFLSHEECIVGILQHNSMASSLWNKLFRTSILKQIAFNEELYIGEDLVFLAEYLKKSNVIYFVENRLYNHLLNSSGAMKSMAGKCIFDKKWISEWRAICLFEDLYRSITSKRYRNNLNCKKVIISNKILTKARKCGYWDNECSSMKRYLTKSRMQRLLNPNISIKLKTKDAMIR